MTSKRKTFKTPCFTCGEPAPRSGYCILHYKSAYLKRTKNKATHKYEKTKNGFLMRVYRNMKSRVTGIQWRKAHLYLGLDIMSKEEFYFWAKKDNNFNELFSVWTVCNYTRQLTPSIDRIDSSKGYVEGNVRWLTHSENSRIATVKRHEKQSA